MSELVPVEELEPGDEVFVGKRTGFREVLEVKSFPPCELEAKRGGIPVMLPPAVVVVYKPAELGSSFENRAKAARGEGYYHRTEASFSRKPGELVERRRT